MRVFALPARNLSRKLCRPPNMKGAVVCPHCGSEEVEQRMPAFYPISERECMMAGRRDRLTQID